MKFSLSTALVVLVAGDAAVASTWFSKAAYNNWHETELERWLSDHDIPYPKSTDRKDLQNLVKTNWQTAIESPYSKWDLTQLTNYLTGTGHQVKKGTEKNKDVLMKQVKSSWYETGDKASGSFDNVKDWIFDSWTDSQLKAFLDSHGVATPNPRKRDSLLKSARENYQTAANKAGDTAAYPGNWLWDSWSDSDLKSWLDARGIPVPQNGARDKMIAAARRNGRTASLNAKHLANEAAASASSAAGKVAASGSSAAGKVASSGSSAAGKAAASVSSVAGWGYNSLSSVAGNAAASLSSAAGHAAASVTSLAGHAAASASSAAANAAASASSLAGHAAASASSGADWAASSLSSGAKRGASSASSGLYDGASSISSGAAAASSGLSEALLGSWSDSQFKAFFDKNGIKVPQGSNRNELIALARKHAAKFTGDNMADSASGAFHAATSSVGSMYSRATDGTILGSNHIGSGIYNQVMYYVMHYINEVLIMLGLKTNYASSAGRSVGGAARSVASAYSSAKAEL